MQQRTSLAMSIGHADSWCEWYRSITERLLRASFLKALRTPTKFHPLHSSLALAHAPLRSLALVTADISSSHPMKSVIFLKLGQAIYFGSLFCSFID